MKNREMYANEIMEFLAKYGETPALVDGKLVRCERVCDHCQFHRKNGHYCNENFAKWLNEETSILTDKEKEYLSAVIKPFRNEPNVYIMKCVYYEQSDECKIIFCCKDTLTTFPRFEDKNMYKGMELNKKYTLEELGISYD